MAKRGRPTKYKPEFCEMLIDHMSEGFSFESFAGLEGVEVCDDSLREWEKKHPEFKEAKKRAFPRNRLAWERIMITKEIHPTLAIFNMKNRFPNEWRDRSEIKQESKQSVSFNDPESKALTEQLVNLATIGKKK